jgi:hypothetical protein
MNTYEFDVFVSHASKDKPKILPIAEFLRDSGLTVWLDEWVIQPGDSIPDAVEYGLQHSRTLILGMSDEAFSSDWVALERQTSTFRDPMNRERRFVPILLANTEIPEMLAPFFYVDLRVITDNSMGKLLAACQVND